MRVLVTGGTGFLGCKAALALQAQGDTVRILGRNPTICAQMEAGNVEVIRGDLRNADTVTAACAGMEAVCHAGTLSAPWGPKNDFVAINVTGTKHVVEGCMRQGVRRLVSISSSSVIFNGQDQENLTENAPYPTRFASIYSQTKAEAEQLVREQQGGKLETVVLRPKALFGPGDTSLLPRLLEAARRHRLPQIGDGANRVDLAYIDNAVLAVQQAMLQPTAVGNIYHITNGESPLLWDVIRYVLKALDYPHHLRPLNFKVAYGFAALLETQSALTHREPLLTRYTVAVLGRTQTYDISSARKSLNYSPKITISEDIERTIAAMKKKS